MGLIKMPIPKSIRTAADHEKALAEIERLIDANPREGSEDANKLEILALLVQDFESKRFPVESSDPIEAIEFRMEQQDLAPRDLVPYIGSRSKVSEVLSRKRTLTLSMIRALHEGLGIPASVLIQEPAITNEYNKPDWNRFPIKEMLQRGWIESLTGTEKFFSQLPRSALSGVLLRASEHIRSARAMDEYALKAWIARVLIQSEKQDLPKYRSGTVTLGFMAELAKQSRQEHGPLVAQNYLAKRGIALIVEPHLPQTYLDGAALLVFAQRPVIGMTLRYDRLDNFWFTLFHELAHISLHSDENYDFIDDLDVDPKSDPKEREADRLAGEALIPEKEWLRSPASRLRSPQAAEHLAKKLGIHPAIVAGRMRHTWKAYRLLNHLVGHKEVRREFPEIEWPN
jgi:HTH-type transcriptional regulator / antitoxin HigA